MLMLLALTAAVNEKSVLMTAMFSVFSFLTIYSFTGFHAYIAPEFGTPSLATMFDRDSGIMNAFSIAVIAMLAAGIFEMLVDHEPDDRWTYIWFIWLLVGASSFALTNLPLDTTILVSGACLLLLGIATAMPMSKSYLPKITRIQIRDVICILSFLILCMWAPTHFRQPLTILCCISGALLLVLQNLQVRNLKLW